jgi:hypothetical protein
MGAQEHVDDWKTIRLQFLRDTLYYFSEKSQERVPSTGPFDILDIGTYQRLSHPVHLFGYSLAYLCQREWHITKTIFQDPAFTPAMRQNIAAALGTGPEQISVKATTEEHLGFTGAGQGIAAHCIALLSTFLS